MGSRPWGYAVRAVRPPYVRASWGSVGDRTKSPRSGILLGFFGTSRLVLCEPIRTASAPNCALSLPQEGRWTSTGSAPSTGPDRFGPGFEPPARGVSWGERVTLEVCHTHFCTICTICTRFSRALWASVGDRTKLPGSGILLCFFGTSVGSYRRRALQGSVGGAYGYGPPVQIGASARSGILPSLSLSTHPNTHSSRVLGFGEGCELAANPVGECF